jgi:transcriptional regulator with XRE-family HTH domain
MLYKYNSEEMGMNDTIGRRIRELRVSRQISLEQMAEQLHTTRQRLARVENDQLDVSYVLLKAIADYLGVSVKEITDVKKQQKGLAGSFRDAQFSDSLIRSVEHIEQILKSFHAQEKRYNQVKARGA